MATHYPSSILLAPLLSGELADQIKAALKTFQAQRAQLDAMEAKMEKKPSWKIRPIEADPETGKLKGGFPQVFLPGYRFATTLNPATWLALFDPQAVYDGLRTMRANLDQHGMDGMRFKDQAEFEAFQLRLDELIRMYQNLI